MNLLREMSGIGFPLPVNSAAYTATGDTTNAGPTVPFKGTVARVSFIPSAAITANGTNFSTITVQNKGTNGLSGTTAVASRVWSAINSVQSVEELFILNATPANLEVAAGDVLQFVQTHTGTGLIIPAGVFVVYVLPRF